MKLHVVIINYRTPRLTADCLDSVAAEAHGFADGELAVTVVDNGSNDGSATKLAELIDERGWRWATLMALAENVGFAAGNNRAIAQQPDADYTLLLNSDTLVHAGCLAHSLAVMESEPAIGVLSCRQVDGEGRTQPIGRAFATPLRQYICATALPWLAPSLFGWAEPDGQWDRAAESRDVDWAPGSFMMIRKAVLEQCGLLDESFFFYGEDYEFCHRAKRAGWRVRYDHEASITHLGAGSSSQDEQAVSRSARLQWKARYLTCRKCHGRPAAWGLRALDLAAYSGATLCHRLLRGRRHPSTRRHANVLALLARPLSRPTTD